MHSTSGRKVGAALAVAAIAPWILTSCAPSTEDASGPESYLFDHLKTRVGTASSVDFDRELDDWLPNQLYRIDGQPPHPLGEGIVVGEITDVTRLVVGSGGVSPELAGGPVA